MPATGQQFAAQLLTQVGDNYVYGAEVDLNDPNPKAHGRPLDCSEGTQWAAYRVGIFLPDGAMNQLAYCRQHGTIMSLAEARRTVGALLFHGPSSPHVAVSLGNNSTVEARNRRDGVGVWGGADRRNFTHAAWPPGLLHGPSGIQVPNPVPAAPNPLELVRFFINLSKQQVIGDRPGMRASGEPVKWCQVLLNAKLHLKDSPEGELTSSVYDHRTMQAILWFQVTLNQFAAAFKKPPLVRQDGIADRATWDYLDTPS